MAVNGMTMMLKSMGLDPEELQKNVETFKAEVISSVSMANNRLHNIEQQNSKILVNQARIIVALEAMYNNKLEEESTKVNSH